MKKTLITFLLITTGIVNAQIVNIPDTYFKDVLLEASPTNEIAKDLSGVFYKIDANNDGEIQESEALGTSFLNISLSAITNLTGIEAFANLEHLDCNTSSLESLDVSQNISLKYLDCNHSGLIPSLDVTQNINLEYLDLSGILNITDIDLTQNINLEYFNGELTQLTSLDLTQNTNLKTLLIHGIYDFENVNLTQNTNLEFLSLAGSHAMSELDLSQNVNLEYLLVSDVEPLSEINVSSSINLETLYCFGNSLLTRLFIKNGSIESTMDISMNDQLEYVCADNDQLDAVIAQVETFTVVSSYCDFAPGGNYNTIEGHVSFDANKDGCDASDLPAQNVRVFIDDGSEQGSTFADSSGDYHFYTQAGNFDLTTSIENPTWFDISPETASILFADNDNNITIQDFCVTANGVHNDAEVLIVPLVSAEPGFDAIYQIVYRNKGNQTLSGAIDFTFNDSVIDFISATVTPDVVTAGNLLWNYLDLRPFETRSFRITLNVNGPTESPPVNIHDILSFSATINPIGGDETPDDNTFNLSQTVVGAYDPNNKNCLEGDSLEPEMIGDYLHYNINFENTGTAAATFVVVKDEIDESMFDISTLQVMYASHDMVTTISGQTVEFVFDNINLGPEEKGNVVFKIKTLNSLEIDDTVSNTAEIFFDYNFPIVTNTTVTTFETLSIDEFELDNAISIFPNPANDILEIKAKSVIEKISLYDVQGRKVLSKVVNSSNTSINVSNFTSGIYFLNIQTDRGELVEKLIKK